MAWFKGEQFKNERAFQEWLKDNETYEHIGGMAGHDLQDNLPTCGPIAQADVTEWFVSSNKSLATETVKNKQLSELGYDPD